MFRKIQIHIHNTKSNLAHNIQTTFKRFPIPFLFAIATVIALIVFFYEFVSTGGKFETSLPLHLVLSSSLGFLLFSCIEVILEKYFSARKGHQQLITLIGFILLAGYHLSLNSMGSVACIIQYFGYSLTLYILLTIIPLISKKESYEMFVVSSFSNLVVTLSCTFIVFMAWNSCLFTFISISFEPISIILGIILFVSVIFGFIIHWVGIPILFLSKLPTSDNRLTTFEYPLLLKRALLYLMIPVLLIFSFLLYIYFGYMLIFQKFQPEIISNSVFWYSCISVLILFLMIPINEEHPWIKKFTRYFPLFIVPLIILLLIALYEHVKTYGITEGPYFMIVVSLWVLGSLFYYLLSKKPKSFFLACSLLVLSSISVTGPWSCFALSKMSQNHQLEKVLAANNMLRDGKVAKASHDISNDDKDRIASIVFYFNQFHHLKEVKVLPPNFSMHYSEEVFGFYFNDGEPACCCEGEH